jgi:alkylation response protein AidB-like acyl-CoA dehydrogenase
MNAEPRAVSDFDAAAIAPVRFGTPEMRALIDAIGKSATASKAEGKNPHPAIELVRQARLGAIRVPAEEGGGGCTIPEYFRMLLDLAEADSDVAQILRVHYWFTEERLRGSDAAVRARWLARIVAGQIFGNAMTEIGTKDPAGSFVMQTKVVPDGEAYRLDGTKFFCTGSLFSDWVWVLASTAEGEQTAVVVPVDREGVTLEDDWVGIGQRYTGSGTGRFDNGLVYPDEVIRSTIEGERDDRKIEIPTAPLLAGQFVQLILTTCIVGNLRNVVTRGVDLVRKRKRTFTHASAETIAADPQMQEIVGRLASATHAAEGMIVRAAEAHAAALATFADGVSDFELTHAASLAAAEAKVFVDELAPSAASQLFELGGASSTVASSGIDQYWRNICTLITHNPTAFKARAIGDYLVNGTRLPMNGYF